MKRTTVKLICLVISIAFILTGCAVVKVDQVMQIAEDTEKVKQDYAKVIADYNGGDVTVMEVTGAYTASYSQILYYYYSYYGSVSSVDEGTIESIKEEVLQNRVETEICMIKAGERGITLTAEEEADCDAKAAETWKSYYETYYDSYAQGETEQEKDASAVYLLLEEGITPEILKSQNRENAILTKLTDELKAEAPAPTEDDVKARYDEKVESFQDEYEKDPASFESELTKDGTIWWMPEGYRAVKHILIVPEEALLTAWKDAKSEVDTITEEIDALNSEKEALADDDAEGARTVEEIDADLESANAKLADAKAKFNACSKDCLDAVKDKTDEVYTRYANGEGEDFSSLIAELAADSDPGMTSGKTAETGYYISENTTTYVSEFKTAAMALEKKGDVSEPVVTQYGVHILYYFDDVASGAVSLDEVRDDIAEELTDEMRDSYYNDTVANWVSEAKPHYYYDRWTVSD